MKRAWHGSCCLGKKRKVRRGSMQPRAHEVIRDVFVLVRYLGYVTGVWYP